MNMKISIAMAVYNGERFLKQQLESIYSQTRQPDELIACDDGSSDNSEAVFNAFILEHHLEGRWKYRKNDANKGYVKNFLDCAAMCTGDVIFFSDQDDVWCNDKIEKMINVFNAYHDAKVVCCSITCIDRDGNSCNTVLNRLRIGNGSIRRVAFERQVSSMSSSGLTLAAKGECIPPMCAIVRKYNLQYDSPFGLMYSVSGNFYRIYQPLVCHRVHSANASVPSYSVRSRMNNYDKHISGREAQCRLLRMCAKEKCNDLAAGQKRKLDEEIAFRQNAIDCMKNRKLLPLFCQLFRVGSMDNKGVDIANFLLTAKRKFENLCKKRHNQW